MYNYECLKECPSGYRIGTDNYCEACESSLNCKYCEFDKNECTECSTTVDSSYKILFEK